MGLIMGSWILVALSHNALEKYSQTQSYMFNLTIIEMIVLNYYLTIVMQVIVKIIIT